MIIGLCGPKQVGKTTIAKYLEDGYQFKRLNFKDALTSELQRTMPDLLEFMRSNHGCESVSDLFDIKPQEVRLLMQNYGTNVRRADDPDYWIKRWCDAVDFATVTGLERLVVDDVRFINEAKEIKNRGGIIVRVVCTDLEATDNHQSETEYLKIEPDFSLSASKGAVKTLLDGMDKIIQDIKAD